MVAVWLLGAATFALAQDSMPRPSGLLPGDPARGRALVADRRQGLCLLCHTAPIAEVRQQGNLAPPLDGAGSRWSEDQLRLRVFDSRRVNPESLMPAYGVADTGLRVGPAWRGKPIFTGQQIEDVVAWLATLK
jgi:sulfur-oxidizing protein SoxX